MATIKAYLLDKGKLLVTEALVGTSVITPLYFKVGDVANFTPDLPNEDTVHGSLVYTGGQNSIRATIVSNDIARYELTIGENEGPFNIGNVILYGVNTDGVIMPYVMVVMPLTIPKKKATDQVPVPDAYVAPGTRVVINIEVKHSTNTPIAQVTVVTPDYSSLASFPGTADIPQGNALVWSQVVSNYDDRTKTPVLFVKDGNNVMWGAPLWQHANDPSFGVLAGGHDGTGYGPNPLEVIQGGFYTVPNEEYHDLSYGGAAYTDNSDNLDVLGGADY